MFVIKKTPETHVHSTMKDSNMMLWQMHNHEMCNYQCQNKVSKLTPVISHRCVNALDHCNYTRQFHVCNTDLTHCVPLLVGIQLDEARSKC